VPTALIIVVLVLLAGLAAVLFAAARFNSVLHGLANRLAAAEPPQDVSASLPPLVREFALRGDAVPGDLARQIAFTQEAEMELQRGRPWRLLRAGQTMAVGAPGFVWLAVQPMGPVPKFRVVDAFTRGAGRLKVALFGLIPVVDAQGAEIDRSEAMRYLAELPWAPDAILGNPHLRWSMLGDDWAEVAMGPEDDPVVVRFRFDPQGDIVEMTAKGRPARDAAGKLMRLDWQGYFRDYRMIGPRRIPAEGEVGYVENGAFKPYFQARILSYEADH